MQKSGFGNPEIRKSGRKSGSENWLGNPGRRNQVRNPGRKCRNPGSEIRKSGNPVGNPGQKTGSEIRVSNPDPGLNCFLFVSEMPVENSGEGLELIEAKLWEHKTDGSR
jgi:hypothetical protein